MGDLVAFAGNCPGNVSKDAKYVVRGNPENNRRDSIVALTYRTADDERWHMSTAEHPELVARVNAIKTALGAPPNGAFYVNEYKQVLVPAVGTDRYYYAGKYETPLDFEFEGKTISGRPVDLDGRPLIPGDEWVGPHPGIPYVLKAGGVDIQFSSFPSPNRERIHRLSKKIGPERARNFAERLRVIKGYQGGRFYVNEFLAMFTPLPAGYDLRYTYLGQLDLADWFPPPIH